MNSYPLPRIVLLACALLLSLNPLQAENLLSCTGLAAGDHHYRGFYIPQYPGKTLETARLALSASAAGSYAVTLTVRANAYNGRVLGTASRSVALSGNTEQNLGVTFIYPSVPIGKGSQVCFTLTMTGPGSLYYSVADWTNGCTEVVQTAGTSPPLSTFRRNGIDLVITGEDTSIVPPGGSIQTYIDLASPGDVVVVEPGTYTEDLTLRSDVSVTGSGFNNTILRGTGAGSVVSAINVTNCQFTGFTITGGGSGSGHAGVSISGGDVLFSNNQIRGNRTGVRIQSSSSALIQNNIVTANGDAGNGFLDYGILSLSSTPLIANNIVANNIGAGIYIGWAASAGTQVINNTVANNTDDGIWCYNGADAVIKNNIFTGNSTGITASHGSAPLISFNNVWNNSWQNYNAQSSGIAAPGLGDISLDPLFDPTATPPYALLEGSPSIDAGDPAPIYNDTDGSRNDQGASGGPSALLSGLTSPVASGFLFNNIGKLPTSEITQTGVSVGLANVSPAVASALSIYPYKDAPFGGNLWLHGLFGINDNSVRYYRIYAAKWTTGSAPLPAEFEPLTNPLSKVKYTVNSSGTVTSTLESVGPDANGLYLRTDRPDSGYWAHPDLKLIWNTRGVANGRYDLICKGYFTFLGFPVEIGLPQNQLSRITVHVDNERVVATIASVRDSLGNPIPECGVIPLQADQEEVQFEITATHPNGFLRDWTLDAVYGRNHHAGTIGSAQYAGFNDSAPPFWAGTSGSIVSSGPAHASSALLPWTTCAYQFRLRAWARTTDGFGHIYHNSFSDHYFLNVGPGLVSACAADLDGDGDVDGQDLVIFASQWGTTNCVALPAAP